MFKQLTMATVGLLISFGAVAAPVVEMQTSMGTIVIELDAEKSPITVKNFVKYAEDGFYTGTIFHRVIDGFMIQGGGFNQSMTEKKVLTPALKSEANNGLSNDRGTVAMARTSDPHSAKVQFFVNLKDNNFLNHRTTNDPQGWGYTVFGKVSKGMDVVDKIAKTPTGNAGYYENVPTTPVIIQNVKIISEK